MTSGHRTVGKLYQPACRHFCTFLLCVPEVGELQQVSTLLYCLGEEADSVLDSTNATEDDRKRYEIVIRTFFKVRRNVIFERARFNRRSQHDGETAEQYILELYRLAENCENDALKEEMIRDRLVVGIQDASLSQQLQLDAALTLHKGKTKVCQREAVAEQQKVAHGHSTPPWRKFIQANSQGAWLYFKLKGG